MKLILTLLCLFVLYCKAEDKLYGSYALPGWKSENPKIEKRIIQFRRKAVGLIAPNEAGRLLLTLECKRHDKAEKTVKFSIKDLDGNVVEGGDIKPGESHTIDYNGLSKCVWRMNIDADISLARLIITSGHCSLEAEPDNSLRPVNFTDRLYFYVNCGRLKLNASGSTPDEHIAITIRDSNDQIVFKGDSLGKKELSIPVDIPIVQEQEGKIWSIQFDRLKWRRFEDMFFSIESGAFPQVALSPRQLILPLFRHECMVLENGNAFSGFTISSFLKEQKGYSATFSFKEASYLPNPLKIQFDVDDTWNTSALYSGKADRHFALKKRESTSRQMVGIEYPKDLLLCGEAHLTIYDSEKKLCAKSCWNFTSWEGQYYAEVQYPEPTDIAEPTSLDISRGFQIFKRDEPGFISIASRPAPSEMCYEIRGETSPGLVSCEFFGFFPLKDMKPNVSLGSLEGPSEIPVENVKLMTVRMWPQQCAKRGTGMFAFTPELMLTEDFSDWVKDIPYQYCIRVSVPKDCSSGIYTAPVLIDGITCAKYKLIVDDFILPEYNDMTFGLYADGKRWIKQNFTDDEILREMHEFREHGINALMLYPLSGSLISYENGTYHVDCSKFRHIMQLYKQVGFPGVAVLSLQGLDSRLSKALDEQITMLSPTFEEGLESVLKTLKTMGEKDGWPDFCIHVIDEPNFKKREKEAIASLKIVKNAGFKTFNTCYPEFVRKMLAPWLDYRCYNNIGYHTSSTQEKNESIRQETLEDGDAFWWYGAGCYVSKGGCQDGNIYSNRHMLGIFNWKSSASGAWSWTFLRCFGNPYNDFDDSIKEQCICYPAFEGHGTIDTLQWEAIREGVYDYRYIRYWDELCKNNIDKPAKRRVVSHSRRRISKTMDSINWNSLNYSVSNTQLRNLRQELIQEIKLLNSHFD